jgi:DNA modification methylase
MRIERIGDAMLYLGDCLKVLPTLGPVDAVVTDPPYGIGMNYEGLTDDSIEKAAPRIREMIELCLPLSPVILTTVGKYSVEVELYKTFPPKWRLCWRKGITSRPSAVGFTDWEPIFVYGNKVHHNSHDLFTATPELMGKYGHPVPKSVDWALWLISHFSHEGETILDPFMGSGTTGVACANLGRRFIGIEIEEKYFDIACRRIRDAYAQPRLPLEEPERVTQGELIE